jgi:hypothetical protein
MLHSLGVNMGPPFWGEHFEAADLSAELRNWWSEPQLVESVTKQIRVEYLKRWLQKHTEPMALATGDALNDVQSIAKSNLLTSDLDDATVTVSMFDTRMMLPVASAVGSGGIHCGAKHPLLSLSAGDVLEAWGPETRFIWLGVRWKNQSIHLGD